MIGIMRIIMVAVISKNGFITSGQNNSLLNWTSDEDKKNFQDLKKLHKFYIMGRKTYDSEQIVAQPGILRLILTRSPEKYNSLKIPGQLEFTDRPLEELINFFGTKYETCLLLGGKEIYDEFLKKHLVQQIQLTVESINLNSGIRLFQNWQEDIIDLSFQKISSKDLNAFGTVLYTYELK
jgi:dihydrofolate reductase